MIFQKNDINNTLLRLSTFIMHTGDSLSSIFQLKDSEIIQLIEYDQRHSYCSQSSI